MKYCFKKICINPIEPAYCVGFVVEKNKSTKSIIDLYARVLRLKDNNEEIIICSIDSLYISYDVYQELNELVKQIYPDALLLTCCTHTHYAPCLANQFPLLELDKVYFAQFKNEFIELIKDMPLSEINGKVDYNWIPFNKVGSTRISKKEDDEVYAGALSIYNDKQRIGNIVFYNCHPTEDVKDPSYFSSAYIGSCIKNLEEDHPDEFFMFLQGSDGDVSSRFTRKERSFNQSIEFGRLLSDCINGLLKKNTNKYQLSLEKNSVTYKFDFSLKDIPSLPDGFLNSLKEAERNELLIGMEELKKFRKMDNLPKYNIINLNRINLGPYRLFFSPFELFTDYNKMIDKDICLLVGYTNGAIAYLLPLNNKDISYEYFIETTNNNDKKLVVEAINSL